MTTNQASTHFYVISLFTTFQLNWSETVIDLSDKNSKIATKSDQALWVYL